MSDKKIRKLVVSALMAALTYVATMVVQIPSPMNGYVNLGDCFVLLSGYGYYAPGTFVIKGLDALVAALIFKAMGRTSAAAIVSGVVGEIIMVVGYFGYAGLLLGKGIGAAASIPGNLVQAAMGLVIGFVLLKVMQKTRIAEKI